MCLFVLGSAREKNSILLQIFCFNVVKIQYFPSLRIYSSYRHALYFAVLPTFVGWLFFFLWLTAFCWDWSWSPKWGKPWKAQSGRETPSDQHFGLRRQRSGERRDKTEVDMWSFEKNKWGDSGRGMFFPFLISFLCWKMEKLRKNLRKTFVWNIF